MLWFLPIVDSLRSDTFGPGLPRVSHIGTDDSEADTAILLVGRKYLRGEGARILLALNETRLTTGKATILLAQGAEKDYKAVLPAYKPRFYRR